MNKKEEILNNVMNNYNTLKKSISDFYEVLDNKSDIFILTDLLKRHLETQEKIYKLLESKKKG